MTDVTHLPVCATRRYNLADCCVKLFFFFLWYSNAVEPPSWGPLSGPSFLAAVGVVFRWLCVLVGQWAAARPWRRLCFHLSSAGSVRSHITASLLADATLVSQNNSLAAKEGIFSATFTHDESCFSSSGAAHIAVPASDASLIPGSLLALVNSLLKPCKTEMAEV